MKFKWTVPYIMFGITLMGTTSVSIARNDAGKEPNKKANKTFTDNNLAYSIVMPYDVALDKKVNDSYLDNKAENLTNAYIENMVVAQKKLGPLLGKHGYNAAVRKELPGAPVGQHCMYGQYTQLTRALSQEGDTITIIPKTANTSCAQFKTQMKSKYKNPEYNNCVAEGKLFENKDAYNKAMKNFLKRNKISDKTPDSVKRAAIEKFKHKNILADSLNPGTILIVPRFHGSRTQFHAIMMMGRGRVEKGQFVPDDAGKYIYIGHNRERIGDLFRTYDTSHVFAADTKKIARVSFAKELNILLNMPTEGLIQFLQSPEMPAEILRLYPRYILQQMARDKYFKKDTKLTKMAPFIAAEDTKKPTTTDWILHCYNQHIM